MKKTLLFLALAAIMAAGCNKERQGFEQKDASLCQMTDSLGIPSMQLSYYEKGGEVHTVLCGADKEVQQDGRELYQAASLSKVVFSYVVMRLVDEGKIDLDTPVAEYTDIDRFEDKEMAAKITPRMVLSHTTGLYNWADSPSADSWPTSIITFHYPVDSCYGYSGEGYAFLQRAAEAVSGKSLNDLATEYVFEPFDMPLSYYSWRPEYDELALCGFNLEGENRGRREGLESNCAFTLRTNSQEYMNFLVHAVLNGEGLAPETYKEWLTPRSHAIRYANEVRDCDKDMYWCLGMGVKVTFDAEGSPVPAQYWHWGDNGSWKALYVVDLNAGKVMDYFTNSAKGHYFCDEVCGLYMGESYGIEPWIDERDDD